ncbi:MAG: HU family DNA-binding protein [Prevotella sp.]|nr:HU family DNA-binding protein [Prevotella sp.]MDY5667253.1 HU family DNA-binding protein [Alloprevotella sp.]
MNNKDFISTLAAQTGSTAKNTQKLVNALTAAVADKLDDDTLFAVQGFGTFEVKKKLERVVVNPNTKQRKLIPPKLVLAFKPSTTLKEKMK